VNVVEALKLKTVSTIERIQSSTRRMNEMTITIIDTWRSVQQRMGAHDWTGESQVDRTEQSRSWIEYIPTHTHMETQRTNINVKQLQIHAMQMNGSTRKHSMHVQCWRLSSHCWSIDILTTI